MPSIKAVLTAWALFAQVLLLSTQTRAGGLPSSDSPTTAAATTVELMLRRDTFTVTEGDPGFNSSVLIFVDIVNPTIGQQMVDLDFNVLSVTAIRDLDYQIEACTMDSDFGSGSGFMNMSGSGFMNESDSGSGFMNESDSGSGFMNVSGSGLMNDSDSGSGFMNVSGSGSGPNQSLALCLNVTIFGDDIVEDVETIIVSFISLNSQVAFVGPSNAQVNITDDDGVQLVAPDQLNVTEGERQQLCVTIQDDNPARERSVEITFGLYPMDTNDTVLLSTNADIPEGDSSVCVFVVANNDVIAEYDESVLIIVSPVNPLDVVNQNTSFLIMDNDGVDLVVRPSDLNLMEGGVMEVCVEFAEGEIPAERVVMISVSETSNQTDLRIIGDLLSIYPGDNGTCFEIEAIDDNIIEDTEVVNVTVMPMNPNDRIMDEITSVTIMDNDVVKLMVLDDMLTVPEGGTALICVNVINSQQLRETDIILSYLVTEGNSFTRENMDFILNDTQLIITPDVSQGCLQFEALDDSSVEDTEQVIVTILMGDLTSGNIITIVEITDNDGVQIMLPTAMEVMEGEELELCIYILPERLERKVNLTFDLVPISPYAGVMDLVLANESMLIIPPINDPMLTPPQICLTLVAIDDQIVEGTESFNFTVRASNPLDMVNGNTTIDITDNDGVEVTLDELNINAEEGDVLQVCASVSTPMHERDVILEFTLIPYSQFASESDARIINDTTQIITPMSDMACVTVEFIDDEIIESTEFFIFNVTANNTLDVVNGTTTIEVADNDGVQILLPTAMEVMEGEELELCVVIYIPPERLEREINLTFDLVLISPYAGEMDLELTNESSIIVPPINGSMLPICLTIAAYDDQIVEGTESFNFTVRASNPLDMVNGSTTIDITDNDGVEVTLDDINIDAEEGDIFQVCASVSTPMRERDVILEFTLTPYGQFARESDARIINDTTQIVGPMSDMACVFVELDDDEIAESAEIFIFNVTANSTLDQVVNGTTTIEVADNDAIAMDDVIIGYMIIIITDNDGVQIVLPTAMEVMEGEELELCVYILSERLEREVNLTFDLVPISPYAGEMDLELTNESSIIVPPINGSMLPICLTFVAYDDQIVEGTESFNFTVRASNPLDMVNGSTTIDITDDDGVEVTLDDINIDAEEGDVLQVCASVNAVLPMRERDVILEFTLTPYSQFARESDAKIINDTTQIIAPMSDTACVFVELIDDEIAESFEIFILNVTANNILDVANGTTTIEVSDNDGVNLTVTEAIELTEGEMSQLCVYYVNEGQPAHERSIDLDFSVMFGSMYTDDNDYNISASSAVIEVGSRRVCINVQAVDDRLIEGLESIAVITDPRNNLDSVSPNSTAVTIVDNDGATLSLTNSSSISLIEGATLSLCVALYDISLLRRTVTVSISSVQSSIEDQATTSLSHSAYLMFTRNNAVECTPLSIDIDMVYSVDRTFILQFMPLNTLDSFIGPNNFIVTIIENGLQFLNIIDLDGTMQLSQLNDVFSSPIYSRDGIPVGTSIETTAYVGDNGFLSFRQGHSFNQPQQFPSDMDAVRDALIVAPYWSDVDIRRQGRIYYRLIEPGRCTKDLDITLLSFVSGFIAARQGDIAANFSATTMLVAQWRDVPPYPNGGGAEGLSQSEADLEFINQTNSFQCVVVTDGQQTFVVFTYNSNMLEWSGPLNHAVIGVNVGTGIQGNFPPFQNHPLSGRPDVPMIANLNLGRGIEWTDIIYKIGDVSQNELDRNRATCVAMYNEDIAQFGCEVSPAPLPCPCSLSQVNLDQRFSFNQNRSSTICFFEFFGRFSIQECCYSISSDSFGALLDPLNSLNGEGSSLLRFNPFSQRADYLATDVAFRNSCCENSDLCDLYYERRPSDNCSLYRPPGRCWFWGDPHFTTLDDRGYTFNGLGEYTLIRIENETAREFELQGRTALVNGSNATQFSAFAFGLPSQAVVEIRVTEMGYLEVLLDDRNITDNITDSPSQFSTLVNIQRPSNIAIDSTVSLNGNSESNMNRIESTFSGGISITITLLSGLLNAVAALPQQFMGQTQGLLGNFNGNATDDFIYPNGTLLNNDASDRMIHDFGLTWQITDDTSLFTYPEGFSVANFSDPDHMPAFLNEVLDAASNETRALCGDNPECIFDAIETGNMEIGLETLQTNQENINDQTIASNTPPLLEGSTTFMITVGQPSVYTFNVTDDSDNVMPMIEMGLPPNAELTNDSNTYTLTWLLMSSDLIDFNRTIRITARDSLNASSLLVPQIQICACDSEGGNCTLDGLIDIIANPLILNCECGPAYTGRFCDEDLDGCTELICFDGVECRDVAAPGEGATCGPCPTGYSGDGLNCMDIDECAMSTHNCEQMCVNTPGGFTCACYDGLTLINETHCIDVNECEILNGGCQQTCINIFGSHFCSCTEGYQLQMDGTTCQVLPGNTCNSTNMCEQNCVFLEGAEVCSCDIGFSLAENNASCLDVNECNATLAICDQLCNNTNGSFVCDCNEGYTLGPDERSCIDDDECLMAAIAGEQLCMIPMVCENIIGGFDCVCPTGSEPFNNDTMCRQICGENFYRVTETQCSRCPENSVRPLNEDESMCACENGYSRRQEDQIDQPCVPHIGFVNARETFQEMSVPNSVSIPLYLSANSSREITVTFTVTPSMYMSFIGSQVVFPPATRMQNLTVNIPGNVNPFGGTIQFFISIDEGSEFVVGGSAGTPLLASVEVTIVEDDNLTPVLQSNSILITLPNLTVETFTSEVQQQFRMTAAEAINTYCGRESCLITESLRRKRQTGVMVTANDIILRDIRNNDQNQLQFSMFVQTNNGQNLLQVDTLQRAIQQTNSTFAANGFTGLRISPLMVPTTQPPAPTTGPRLSDGAIAGIVIGTTVGAILLVLLLIFIVALVRRYNHSKTVVLNTYGFQVYRKAKGPSIRQSNRNGSDQNLYVQTPAVEMKDIDTEPIVSVHTSSLVEKEEEEGETEMFANKAATESENGVSLSEDIARELGEGQETQVMKMSFDEPGEETKL